MSDLSLARALGWNYADLLQSTSNIRFLLSIMHLVPISWRKLAIAVSRIQVRPDRNAQLTRMVHDIKYSFELQVQIPGTAASIHLDRFISIINKRFLHSPIYLSMLNYFARAELIPDPDVTAKIISEAIKKELDASQVIDLEPQQLTYDSLSRDGSVTGFHAELGPNPKLQEALRRGLAAFKAAISSPTHIIYQDRVE